MERREGGERGRREGREEGGERGGVEEDKRRRVI